MPTDFSVMPLDSLPLWHLPFKCDLFARFDGESEAGDAERVEAFNLWMNDQPEQLGTCSYHREPYSEAMGLAIAFFKRFRVADNWGERPDGSPRSVGEAMLDCLKQVRASKKAKSHAWLFVVEPICWLEGTDYLTNGQHRSCALRQAGVATVLVCVK
jgi:hypothetical protein